MIGMMDLFFSLLFSSVAGSIFLLIWLLARKALDKWGYIRLSYRLLELLLLVWVPPLCYLAVLGRQCNWDGSINSALLSPSPRIAYVLTLAFPVWAAGVVAGILYYLFWGISFYKGHRDYVEGSLDMVSLLDDCKKKTGVKKRIAIRQCYGQDVPVTYGVFRPVILLPMDIPSKGELEMVLIHELIHVKRNDLLVKRLAFIVLVLQWMNPLAWRMFILIEKWSEYSCDYEACEILGKPREYFQMILGMAMKESARKGILTSLFEDRHQVLKRVEMMDSYRKIKKKGKTAAFLLAGAAMLAGSMTALAASDGIVKGYDIIWDALSPEEEIIVELPEYTEYVETETGPQIRIEVREVSAVSAGAFFISSWSVDNMVLMQTGSFSASEGGSITVGCFIRPKDKEVKVGIITPDGSRRYIKGTEGIFYEFELDVSGEYQVFVENTSGTAVQAEGYYVVD